MTLAIQALGQGGYDLAEFVMKEIQFTPDVVHDEPR
jgi:hypothetical protein